MQQEKERGDTEESISREKRKMRYFQGTRPASKTSKLEDGQSQQESEDEKTMDVEPEVQLDEYDELVRFIPPRPPPPSINSLLLISPIECSRRHSSCSPILSVQKIPNKVSFGNNPGSSFPTVSDEVSSVERHKPTHKLKNDLHQDFSSSRGLKKVRRKAIIKVCHGSHHATNSGFVSGLRRGLAWQRRVGCQVHDSSPEREPSLLDALQCLENEGRNPSRKVLATVREALADDPLAEHSSSKAIIQLTTRLPTVTDSHCAGTILNILHDNVHFIDGDHGHKMVVQSTLVRSYGN
jgi:hypothetical protein